MGVNLDKIKYELEQKTSNLEQKLENLSSNIYSKGKEIENINTLINRHNKIILTIFKMNYKNKNLELVSNRNYICDICRNHYSSFSYYCDIFDFDICPNCLGYYL